MRRHVKLLTVVGLLGVVALMIARQSSAQNSDHFDEQNLRGVYVGSLTGFPNGFLVNGVATAGVAIITADGAGNLTFEGRVNSGGAYQTPPPITCGYEIEPSGFGTVGTNTMPCTVNAIPVPRAFTILLSQGGTSFDIITKPPSSSVLSGHFVRRQG